MPFESKEKEIACHVNAIAALHVGKRPPADCTSFNKLKKLKKPKAARRDPYFAAAWKRQKTWEDRKIGSGLQGTMDTPITRAMAEAGVSSQEISATSRLEEQARKLAERHGLARL